jgi:hypothetical protein
LKYFKFIGTMVLLSLILAVLVIPVVAANPAVDLPLAGLSTQTGLPGDEVTLTIENFKCFDKVDVYFSKDIAILGDEVGVVVQSYKKVKTSEVESSGKTYIDFKIPSVVRVGKSNQAIDIENGDYFIYVTDSESNLILYEIPFTVGYDGNESIELSATSSGRASRGIEEKITIEGYNFKGSDVNIYISSDEAQSGDEINDEVTTYKRVKSGSDVDISFVVPSYLFDYVNNVKVSIEPGDYYVYITYKGDDTIVAASEFSLY